ncbi:MAG: 4Fe-4S binding protein [Desulfobulbaceae bacterium]|nr:4Fe-4S binding protein [Desulfobulbaceae bacterium]HIJ79614.1 4Fe-4S binding protein [Deltaproteobacteria bacterium]
MCEFCTKHGDGQVWFKNAANYARDLMADLNRRNYIKGFFTSTIEAGVSTIGRLETIYQKKKVLPERLVRQMIAQAGEEHFGQVVTIEDIRAIVGRAATVVRMPCACRWAALKKENRCCYSVSYTPETWYRDLDMSYFGKTQDMGLESLTPDEAIRQMEALEQEGAVHTIWTMVTPFIGAICNCQPGDCLGLRTLAIDVETMYRGEEEARVDDGLCNGCGSCEEACHFHAIAAVSSADGYRAVIDPQKCFGCGLCRNHCPQEAIRMVARSWG